MIDENDYGEVCNDADIYENPMDKAQVLSKVLPLLEKLHASGARLNYCHILDALSLTTLFTCEGFHFQNAVAS